MKRQELTYKCVEITWFCHLPSNGAALNIALIDIDQLIECKQFEIVISLKQ